MGPWVRSEPRRKNPFVQKKTQALIYLTAHTLQLDRFLLDTEELDLNRDFIAVV